MGVFQSVKRQKKLWKGASFKDEPFKWNKQLIKYSCITQFDIVTLFIVWLAAMPTLFFLVDTVKYATLKKDNRYSC